MKKIFTSIGMALCLMVSSFNASAQQTAVRLSDAQKQEIQQKVLPVVFEQIKENIGIDILGWAQPKLTTDYLESLPIFYQLQGNSGLRADAATPYRVKPDSIKLDLGAISPDLASFGVAKILFDDYFDVKLPVLEIGGRTITVVIPRTISVILENLPTTSLMDIYIVNRSSGITLDIDFVAVLFGDLANNTWELMNLKTKLNAESLSYDINVDFKDGMVNLWGLMLMMQLPLPAPTFLNSDYQISIDIQRVGEMIFPVSLYGISESSEKTPMGDAVLALDLTSGKTLPVNYIDVTSYAEGKKVAWNTMWFTETRKDGNIVETIDNYKFGSEQRTDSTLDASTRITMSSGEAVKTVNLANAQSAVHAVVNNVIAELATEGSASYYEMLIEQWNDANKDGKSADNEFVPTTKIVVNPYIDADANSAIAEIDIQSYEGGAPVSVATVKATAGLAESDVIAVEVEVGGKPVGSAYFTSNIAGIIVHPTDNEYIRLANVEVTPVKDGIYVSGTTTAAYRIVSMSGATVACGTVSGDNAYISTSALAKGIYVIVITENGESKAVKFAR